MIRTVAELITIRLHLILDNLDLHIDLHFRLRNEKKKK